MWRKQKSPVGPHIHLGQQSPRGVTRPPLVTEQQRTPPPVNPTRTETPEPRSYGEQLRRQADALRKQVRDLVDANAELWDAVRTRDGRIVGLSGDNYRLAEGNKTLAARVTALEAEVGQCKETARNLALAAEEVDKRRRAELAAATARLAGMLREMDAPTGVDPQPTKPLPTWVTHIIGDQGRTDAPADFPTPWQSGAWGPRSSGGQSAPMVGE